MKKIVTAIAIGLTTAALLQGCIAASPYETPEEFMNSSIITTSVKTRLASTAGLESLSLNIQTIKGDILISGFVQNQEQKTLAGQVAERTEGVHKVINNIVVR